MDSVSFLYLCIYPHPDFHTKFKCPNLKMYNVIGFLYGTYDSRIFYNSVQQRYKDINSIFSQELVMSLSFVLCSIGNNQNNCHEDSGKFFIGQYTKVEIAFGHNAL